MEAEMRASRPRRLVPIIGGVATALSLIVGVIAIVPILTQNASDVGKLDVSAEPYRPGDILLYSIPVDLVPQLPVEEGDVCGPDRLSWLEANAEPVDGYYFVTITNRATSGNVISFSDIIGVGESSVPDGGAIVIECDQQSANRIAPALLNASSGQAAYYDRSRMDDAGTTPETPLIYNLAPGETGQFVLLVVSANAFNGEVQYEVTSGAEHTTGLFDLGGTVDLPGTSPFSPAIVLAGDPLWACSTSAPIPECRE